MDGVLIGFAIIGVLVGVGYALARTKIVPAESRTILNNTAFFAASPALLFTVLAESDVRVVFSGGLVAELIAVLASVIVYVVVARLWFTRGAERLAIGATASGYSNLNNIGIPVSVYVLGGAGYVAPHLLVQVVVLMPIVLLVLDTISAKRVSLGRILTQPLRNPIVIGSALGLVVALTGIELPPIVWTPIEILGGAAVPLMLLAFGASLHGERPFRAGSGRREILLASALKSIVAPVIAFLVARFAFGLEPQAVFAATVVAALPTAQNVYQFALRYQAAPIVARDVILITTFVSFPVILVIAALIHP